MISRWEALLGSWNIVLIQLGYYFYLLCSSLEIDHPGSHRICFYCVTRVTFELWPNWTVTNCVNSVSYLSYLILSSSSPLQQLFWCLICLSHPSSPLLSPPVLLSSPDPGHNKKDKISKCQQKSNQISNFLMWWLDHKLNWLFEHTNQYQMIQKQTINALFHLIGAK